jgi:hypothetical protein
MIPAKNRYDLAPDDDEDWYGDEEPDDDEPERITPETRCTAAQWLEPGLWGQCPRLRAKGSELCPRCVEDMGEWEEHRKADESRAWAMTVRLPIPRLIDAAVTGGVERKAWVRGLIDRHPGRRQVWAAFRRFAGTEIDFELAPESDISTPAKFRRVLHMIFRGEKSLADSVSQRCGQTTRRAMQHVLGLKDEELVLWFMAYCTHDLVKGKIVEADW